MWWCCLGRQTTILLVSYLENVNLIRLGKSLDQSSKFPKAKNGVSFQVLLTSPFFFRCELNQLELLAILSIPLMYFFLHYFLYLVEYFTSFASDSMCFQNPFSFIAAIGSSNTLSSQSASLQISCYQYKLISTIVLLTKLYFVI